jgi:hypothetical protein
MFGQLAYQPIGYPLGSGHPITFDAGKFSELDGRSAEERLEMDADQFTLFQLAAGNVGRPVVDLHAATPTLKGGDDNPNVRVSIDLLSFRIAPTEGLDPKMQATLRLDMGNDRSSPSPLDPLFWSIAAGFYLAAQAVTPPAEAKSLNADFLQGVQAAAIEISGGLGQLRSEVVAHEELPW